MISLRTAKFLSLALLLSGGSVVLTQQWLHGAVQKASTDARAGAMPAATPTRRVLVAKAPIATGAILAANQLEWRDWPASANISGYVSDSSPEQLTGAVVRTSLGAGEPIRADGLVKPGERSFLAAVLSPGYRAVTVNVSVATGVGGFVMPGDHVDLIVTRNAAGAETSHPRQVSETVLNDVRVLGVDQRAANEKNQVIVPQTATLEVSPKGAEIVAVAQELGKLSLALRSVATPAAPVEEARTVTRTWDTDAVQAPVSRPVVRRRTTAAAVAAQSAVVVVRGDAS